MATELEAKEEPGKEPGKELEEEPKEESKGVSKGHSEEKPEKKKPEKKLCPDCGKAMRRPPKVKRIYMREDCRRDVIADHTIDRNQLRCLSCELEAAVQLYHKVLAEFRYLHDADSETNERKCNKYRMDSRHLPVSIQLGVAETFTKASKLQQAALFLALHPHFAIWGKRVRLKDPEDKKRGEVIAWLRMPAM